MNANRETKSAIMKVLRSLSDGFTNKNVGRVLELFAADADVIFLASEEGEKARGIDELRALLNGLFSRPESYA